MSTLPIMPITTAAERDGAPSRLRLFLSFSSEDFRAHEFKQNLGHAEIETQDIVETMVKIRIAPLRIRVSPRYNLGSLFQCGGCDAEELKARNLLCVVNNSGNAACVDNTDNKGECQGKKHNQTCISRTLSADRPANM